MIKRQINIFCKILVISLGLKWYIDIEFPCNIQNQCIANIFESAFVRKKKPSQTTWEYGDAEIKRVEYERENHRQRRQYVFIRLYFSATVH